MAAAATTTFFALASFVCMHADSAYETCVPYLVRGFVSEDACIASSYKLQALLVSAGQPGDHIRVDADCAAYGGLSDGRPLFDPSKGKSF